VCYKIPSAGLTDHALLRKLRETRAVDPVHRHVDYGTNPPVGGILGTENLVITHATSTYPCEPDELNLRVIAIWRAEFPCPIGYSGHEVGLIPSVVSVAMALAW